MKKILVCLLSVVLIFASFTGCTTKSKVEKKDGVDYTFNGHEIGETVYVKVLDAGFGEDWIKALADAYYEETGIIVDTSSDPSLTTSSETKMNQSGSEKEDIYWVAQGQSNWLDWVNTNKIASLDDVLSSTKYGTAATTRTGDDMVLQLGKYGDSVYLVPYVYSNWGIVYNQAYLDKIESYGEYTKGVWPTTMQGLIDLCTATKNAKITNTRTGKTVEPFSCGLTVNYMDNLFYSLWDELDSAGLTAYLNQSNKAGYDSSEFNSTEVKQVFEVLYDLIGAKSNTESNLCANAENHLESQTNFVNGNCVFTFTGVWFESEMKKILSSVGLNTYHYGSYPTINSGSQSRLYMNMPGEFFFIPSDAENVWGAKDFLAFCFSEKGIAAAERKMGIPLCFTTTEEVTYSTFGQEVKNVVNNNKHLYIYANTDIYKTGALRLFLQTTNPFLQISKYNITSKTQIQSNIIDTEIAQHNSIWADYMEHIK